MKRQLLSIVLVLAIIAGCFSSVTCTNVSAATKKKTVLSSKSVTMKVGQKKTLKLKNYKKLSKKNIKKVKWSTTNKKVVTVKYSGKYRQKGKITAKKKGSAYIKVKYNGKTYKCKVVVKVKEEPTTEAKTTEKVTTEAKTTEKTTEKVTTEKTTERVTTEHIHNWGNWVVVKDATCEEDGQEIRTCSSCGVSEKRTTKALGHSYNDGVVTKEATCKEKGVKTYTCERCKHTKTEEISNKGIDHTWNNPIVIEPATCSKEGSQSVTCKICGETKIEAIPKTNNHKWSIGSVTKEPTCAEEGEKTHTCSVCGETKVEAIPKTDNHKYNDGVITIEPTCSKNGVKTYTCSVCGDVKTEVVKATGLHTYDEGVITTEPTCSTPGIKTYTCVDCGKTKTENIPSTGIHTYESSTTPSTYNKNGYISNKCTECEHEDSSSRIYLPLADTVNSISLDENDMITVDSVSVLSKYYFKLLRVSTGCTLKSNNTDKILKVRAYYLDSSKEIAFDLDVHEDGTAVEGKRISYSISELQDLLEDERFNGMYYGDTTWEGKTVFEKYESCKNLNRFTDTDGLNLHDMYYDENNNKMYITPQVIWAVAVANGYSEKDGYTDEWGIGFSEYIYEIE